MPDTIFQSTQNFKQQFIKHLQQMMCHEDFGVFILVLANAISRPEIYQTLSADLSWNFSQLKEKLNKLSHTELIRIPADDLSVFKAISRLTLDEIQLTSIRTTGYWQLQYNPLRSFRPARNSQKKISQLHQPFDKNSFNFNKPFLSREILWQGQLAKTPIRLLYNKFPFADYHGLLVIQPELEKPQFLQQQDCLQTEQILAELSNMQGCGLAYNSLGAYASVNHQHWQLFLSDQDYPIEHSHWNHNAGPVGYPIEVECFQTLTQAWLLIDSYQQSNTAFNLLIRPDKTYLVKRKKQGEYQHNSWTGGFAWSEIMGNIMTTGLESFNQLDEKAIEMEFQLPGV